MGLRDEIIKQAKAELAKQSGTPGPEGPISQEPSKRYKENGRETRGGWQRLEDMFANAIENFERRGDPSFKKWGEKNEKPLGKDWCGIFATHVLVNAGTSAKWSLKSGTLSGTGVVKLDLWMRDDVKFIPTAERTTENLCIEPGDVIVLNEEPHHHCIVVGIDASRREVETIEGNTAFQEIRAGKKKLEKVASLYKVVQETKFSAAAFEPVKAVPPTFMKALPGTWRTTRTNNNNGWYTT